jgi:thiol-disulfide isomerase/thioredoxin
MAKMNRSNLMWKVGFLLLVIAVGVVSFQLLGKKEGYSNSSDVNRVKKGNGVLVVTMKNCPHCETMKEDLEKLSEAKEAKGYFAWADSKDADVSDLDISSYPTILVFKKGKSTSYNQGRSYADLMKLVNSTKSS